MHVRLFVIRHLAAETPREDGFELALRRNIDCGQFSSIHILSSSPCDISSPLQSSNVQWIKVAHEPSPAAEPILAVINRHVTSPDDLSVLCEDSAYFDSTLAQLRHVNLEGICLALSARHPDTQKTVRRDSEAPTIAWVFQGRIRPVLNSPLAWNLPGIEQRLIWEFRHADYHVCNPCQSIKCTSHPNRKPRATKEPVRSRGALPKPCTLLQAGLGPKQVSRTGVIAFSLFGTKAKYCMGAIENAKLAKWLYPGWTVRYYVDNSVPEEVLLQLRSQHAEIVEMPASELREGMFWRFLAADDLGFSRWMIRDVDSRLNYRERRAVDEWLDSGRPYHILRDHPAHRNPIMACGFGSVRGALPKMADLIRDWRNAGLPYGKYADDERFLARAIWPRVKQTALIHDAHAPAYTKNVRPFPTPYENYRFVGERIFQDEHCSHADRGMLIQSQVQLHQAKLAS